MSNSANQKGYDPWPALSAEEFSKTSHLLHMGIQMVGKLMLNQPFEPHWANLAMPLTSRGITTGIIPFRSRTFSVDLDLIEHRIICTASSGQEAVVKLESQSVAELYAKIMKALASIGVDVRINTKPQEISNPIDFKEDTTPRIYDEGTVNAWWRIMVSTYLVLQRFHSNFMGSRQESVYSGEHLI